MNIFYIYASFTNININNNNISNENAYIYVKYPKCAMCVCLKYYIYTLKRLQKYI